MGELVMRGPWITESYFQLPDNADRFLDGWWRSGDVGTIDEHGYLKITDRLKDVIKSGGEWISSIDMENAILDNPDVSEAAVIGVPDEKWDERPIAYVVANPGAEVTVDLENRQVHAGESTFRFDIDDYTRWRLMEGLDDIGLTLRHEQDISDFEATRPGWMPKTLPARTADSV